jgi:hypothetical protein
MGDEINRSVLEIERVSPECALSQHALDRLQRPKREQDQRIPGFRVGDPRVVPLFPAVQQVPRETATALHASFRRFDFMR